MHNTSTDTAVVPEQIIATLCYHVVDPSTVKCYIR